jgi:hypothetical protein
VKKFKEKTSDMDKDDKEKSKFHTYSKSD